METDTPMTERERERWLLHTNRDQKPDGSRQTVDPYTRPAPSFTAKSGGQWYMKSDTEILRLTIEDALILQSFPPNFPVQGKRTAAFRQTGNAIAPVVAAHVLAMVTGLVPPCLPARPTATDSGDA